MIEIPFYLIMVYIANIYPNMTHFSYFILPKNRWLVVSSFYSHNEQFIFKSTSPFFFIVFLLGILFSRTMHKKNNTP